MNDPYRTAADVKQVPPPRPYKVMVLSWEDNDDWREELELKLLEWYHAGYDVHTITEDPSNCEFFILLKLRSST